MLTLFLLIVMWSINLYVFFYYSTFTLEYRFSDKLCIALEIICSIGIVILRWYYVVNGSQEEVSAVSNIVTVTLIVFQIICFKGKWYKRLLTLLYIILFSMIVELFASGLSALIIGTDYVLYDMENPGFRFAVLMDYPFYCLILYPLKRLLEMLNKADDKYHDMTWIIALFPVSQLLFILFLTDKTAITNPMALFGMVLGAVADFAIVAIINRQSELAWEQEQLKISRELHKVEMEKYEALEKREDEISKIRHDYQNQLMSLMAMKEKESN